MSHHSCLCAPSLRCLSCLGEYGINQVRVLSFPSCLPKSRDEIFLRGGHCHNPGKKRGKENKNPTGPHSSVSPSPSLCFCLAARRGTRRRRPTPTRAGHPRPPCHARPPLALILPRDRVPLFLLFLLAHEPSRAARRHPRLSRRRRFLASGRSPRDS